jgi:hypothetical protein
MFFSSRIEGEPEEGAVRRREAYGFTIAFGGTNALVGVERRYPNSIKDRYVRLAVFGTRKNSTAILDYIRVSYIA